MGTVRKIVSPKTGRASWVVSYTDPSGRRRKITSQRWTKKQAEAALAKLEAEIFEGDYYPNKKKREERLIMHQLRAMWLKHASPKKSLRNDKQRFERIVEFFGAEREVKTITSPEIDDFRAWLGVQVTRRKKPMAAGTVNRHLALLKSAFNLAVETGYLDRSPASRSRLLDEEGYRDRICTPKELDQILLVTSNDDPRMHVATVLGYETGMRLGEIIGLRWPDIDLTKRQLRIRESKTDRGQRRLKGRWVPLSKRAAQALRSYLRWQMKQDGFDEDRLFNMKRDSASTYFSKITESLGIRDLRFHDLRHTAATNMRRRGVDVVTLKQIFGWRSWSTLERYQVIDAGDLLSAVD